MISFHPEIVARCIFQPKQKLRNVALWSRTSKVFYEMINSKEFFKVLVYLAGSREFLTQEILDLGCFKTRYCALCSILPKKKNEEFRGVTYGDAWVGDEGVEVISLSNETGYFQLKENAVFNSLEFSEDMPLDLGEWERFSSTVARSKEYLAIHGSGALVYIYKFDEKKFLSTYKVIGEVVQLAIVGNLLYVIADNDEFVEDPSYEPNTSCIFGLHVYDLNASVELNKCSLVNICDNSTFCFGKEYLIYTSNLIKSRRTCALRLSDLRGEIVSDASLGRVSYLFSSGKDFIEVFLKKDNVCDLVKFSFEDGVAKSILIKEDLKLSEKDKFSVMDVCLHDDRLIVAYKGSDLAIDILSYDILSEKLTELHSVPIVDKSIALFRQQLLCLDEKVFYLYMRKVNENEYKSDLTTLTFSKI